VRIVRRRSERSTRAPPRGPKVSQARYCAAVTDVTSSGEVVSDVAKSGSALSRIPSPMLDTSDPTYSARKPDPSERLPMRS